MFPSIVMNCSSIGLEYIWCFSWAVYLWGIKWQVSHFVPPLWKNPPQKLITPFFLLNPHSLQFFGKYGCFFENSCPSLPGLFSSPRCGWSPRISASVGKGVIRSSIASSEHLLFQRLPGRCLLQNGSSIRRVSLRSQKTRCSALWMLRTPD